MDGAGSLYSTTADLARFNQGLNSDDFLSKPMREVMVYQHVKEKFGYGWYLRERGGTWAVSYHKSDLPGYTSFMSRFRRRLLYFNNLRSRIKHTSIPFIDQ